MQILRIPPYPLTVTYDVPDASTDYKVIIMDEKRNRVWAEYELESNVSSKLDIQLSDDFDKYDESYYLAIYEDGEHDGPLVVEDNLEIVRPYVNPNTLGKTATEIAEYIKYERLARLIIDSVTNGFYYKTDWIETVGQGTDYIPIWDRAYKVLEVYQNSKLVYDHDEDPPSIDSWNYEITQDMSAIVKSPAGEELEFNRSERKPARMAIGASDSIAFFDTEDSPNFQTFQPGVTFPEGVDYLIYLETGYKVVPYDIKEATLMLIEDIKCGKLDYYKRYITSYSNDQYDIEIDKSAFEGTGNILVDKILKKYTKTIGKPGVL